jgi:hypothetical protein
VPTGKNMSSTSNASSGVTLLLLLQELRVSCDADYTSWQRKMRQPVLSHLSALTYLSCTGEGLFAVQADEVRRKGGGDILKRKQLAVPRIAASFLPRYKVHMIPPPPNTHILPYRITITSAARERDSLQCRQTLLVDEARERGGNNALKQKQQAHPPAICTHLQSVCTFSLCHTMQCIPSGRKCMRSLTASFT